MNIPAVISDQVIPVLETERLVLRSYTQDDAEGLYQLFTDERVITAFGYRMPPTYEAAKGIIARWQQEFRNGTGIRWVITDKATGTAVGNIGLKDIKAYHQSAAVGYAVLPAWWRRGIAAEALRTVIDHASGPMDLHRIEAEVFPHNTASQALLRQTGFRLEGLFRSAYKFDGAFHDCLLFARINERHLNRSR